jgi:hypothetical protein
MTGSLRKSVTIGACLVFIVMDRRADFYTTCGRDMLFFK